MQFIKGIERWLLLMIERHERDRPIPLAIHDVDLAETCILTEICILQLGIVSDCQNREEIGLPPASIP